MKTRTEVRDELADEFLADRMLLQHVGTSTEASVVNVVLLKDIAVSLRMLVDRRRVTNSRRGIE